MFAPTVRRFWQQRDWTAAVHYFDHDGRYVRTDTWSAGRQGWSDYTGIGLAEQKLNSWLDALPGFSYGDISIRLFKVEISGTLFGLLDQSDDNGQHVEL